METIQASKAIYTRIKRHKIEGDTPAGLRQAVRWFIDSRGYGMSEIGGRWRVIGHPTIRNISYNGRFWDGHGQEVVI